MKVLFTIKPTVRYATNITVLCKNTLQLFLMIIDICSSDLFSGMTVD